MKTTLLISLFIMAGCATAKPKFDRPGATESDLKMDDGQCTVQAIAPFYGSWGPFGSPPIYRACMQGKGWNEVEVKSSAVPAAAPSEN